MRDVYMYRAQSEGWSKVWFDFKDMPFDIEQDVNDSKIIFSFNIFFSFFRVLEKLNFMIYKQQNKQIKNEKNVKVSNIIII